MIQPDIHAPADENAWDQGLLAVTKLLAEVARLKGELAQRDLTIESVDEQIEILAKRSRKLAKELDSTEQRGARRDLVLARLEKKMVDFTDRFEFERKDNLSLRDRLEELTDDNQRQHLLNETLQAELDKLRDEKAALMKARARRKAVTAGQGKCAASLAGCGA